MGMSTHIVGFRPPDEKWEKMKAAYRACIDAGIDPPDEVDNFFQDNDPNGPGGEIRLIDRGDNPKVEGVRKYSTDGSSGYEVDLERLPKNIRYIRFYNSW